MPDLSSLLAERLTLARKMRDLTQAELAKLADIPQSQISKFERKTIQDPGINLIASLCQALGLPLAVFVEGSMEELLAELARTVEKETDFGSDAFHQETGVVFGVNASTKSEVIINRFNQNNPNIIAFGTSGSGKSYSAKSRLLQEAMQGENIVILDPQAEYTKICKALKGQLIELSESTIINPLDFSVRFHDGIDARQAFLSHMSFVIPWLEEMCNATSDTHRVFLERALRKLYENYGYTPDTCKDATSQKMPILSDLYAMLARIRAIAGSEVNAPISEMLMTLSEFVGHGRYANYLDGLTTAVWDEKQSLHVVSLLGYGDIFPIRMHLASMWISAHVFVAKPKKTLWYVDEAQRFAGSKAALRYLEDLTRQSRKFTCGMTLLVQDPDVFLLSPDGVAPNRHGRAILNNCSTRIVLHTSPSSLQVIEKMFLLSHEEMKKLASLSVGEFLLFVGGAKAWVTARDINSPQTHELITEFTQEDIQDETNED